MFTDRVVPLGAALGVNEERLLGEISAQADQASRVDLLGAGLENLIAVAEPQRVLRARQVAEVARLAEADRSLQRLDDLCLASGIGPRKLQRLFLQCAGVSPTWTLRRYRLLDAAEAVRDGQPASWAGSS